MVINKFSKEIRSKVKIFLDLIDRSFSFLENYGYNIKNERLASEFSVDDVVQVTYYNKEIDRLIAIQYEPKDIDGKSINLVTISFFKGDDPFLDDELKFDIYIRKYGNENQIDVLNLKYPDRNNESSFRKNLDISINGYLYYLKDIGISLINGDEWENNLIIDWSNAEKVIYNEQKKGLER